MEPAPTQSTQALCGICNLRCPIYTCPRCATRTCSLSCSKSHKALQSCSGERDKTAYVPMNKYDWGTMANDYVYLEEVGRKTAEWGHDIVKSGLLAGAAVAGRGPGPGRGRGKATRGPPQGGGRGRRDVLKMQLDVRDIDMELLPPGMEKRRMNQSTWDVRTKSPLISLEFIFHPVKNPLAPSASPAPPSFTLLTHRNKLDLTILDAIQRHVAERGKKDTLPAWIKSLATPSGDEEASTLYLMAQQSTSPSHPVSKAYHTLDATQPLSTSLRHKSFVEYPTIDVWEDSDGFNGALVEADGTFVKGEDGLPSAKRRRLDVVGGRKMMEGLLGEYKSEEEAEEKIEEENVLDMLGDYGSEEELESGGEGAGHEVEDDADAMQRPTLEDLRDIFEVVGQESQTEAQIPWLGGEDDEEVDWGDGTDEEVEVLERALREQKASQQTA